MNEIDRLFKNKLNNHNSDFPVNLWDNIETALDKQEHRVWGNLPWSIAAIAISIVVSVMSFWIINANQHTESQHLNQQITNHLPGATHEFNLSSSNILSPSVKDNEVLETTSNGLVIQSPNPALSDNNGFKASDNLQVFSNPIQKYESDLTKEKQLPSIVPSNFAAQETDLDEIQKPYTKVMSVEPLSNSLLTSFGYNSQGINIQNLQLQTEPFKACPFNMDYRDKSLDIYFASDYIDKKLSSQSGDATLKNMRLATEKPMYSFSVGIRLGYNVGYRWNLHTGINYSQINEKFEYTDPESSKVRIVIVKDYIYENGQIVDSIVKQEEVLVPGSTQLTVYNKFRTLDIPLLVRYTILANRSLSLSALSGIFVNIASYEKGMIISDETLKPEHITKLDEEGSVIYKNQLGMSVYGSLSLAYHLTNNTDVLLEPYARINPSSVTVSTYPLSQKFSSYGLNLGVRYKF